MPSINTYQTTLCNVPVVGMVGSLTLLLLSRITAMRKCHLQSSSGNITDYIELSHDFGFCGSRFLVVLCFSISFNAETTQ